MQGWKKGINKAHFFVGDEGEGEGDQKAGRCELVFYGCGEGRLRWRRISWEQGLTYADDSEGKESGEEEWIAL